MKGVFAILTAIEIIPTLECALQTGSEVQIWQGPTHWNCFARGVIRTHLGWNQG
jgi:hypothetical protein